MILFHQGDINMSIAKVLGAGTLALAFGLGGAAMPQALADPEVERFFQGKRIQMIIGSGAGGGYDTYARLVSRHIGRHIPGNPSIDPQNMPGAGGVVAANFVANVAPRDGTVMAATQREIPLIQIMGQEGPRYDAAKLNWLGSLSSEPGVCAVMTRTGIESFSEVFERNVVIGGTGANITEFHPAMLNNLLGARFQLIRGYASTTDIQLAMQRGEVDAICQSWASFKNQAASMLEAQEVRPVVQMALRPAPEMEALGIPMIYDFITADRVVEGFTVDQARSFFDIVMSTGHAGRPFFYAEGVPAPRVAALRRAFTAMVDDAAFKAESERLGRTVEFVSGEEIQEVVEGIAATPKAMLDQVDELLVFRGPAGR